MKLPVKDLQIEEHLSGSIQLLKLEYLRKSEG